MVMGVFRDRLLSVFTNIPSLVAVLGDVFHISRDTMGDSPTAIRESSTEEWISTLF